MNILYIISPIAAILLTYLLIPFIRKIALLIELVDKPNHRKVHYQPVPLVGGISIFIATSLVLALTISIDSGILGNKNIFIAAFILLVMGVIDDRFDLRATLKLGIQLILAHYIFEQGIKIESFYGFLGIYELAPWAQYIVTVTVITGVINAFNLMDGIDGLAAGIAILGFGVLTLLSVLIGNSTMTLIFLTLIGSLFIFLRFNLSVKQKIFMGDAGSIVLGFILVVSSISLLQSAHHSEYLYWVALGVVAVLIVPVLDALRVFRKRAKSGKSPFHADKTHLHHLILSLGLKHKMTTITILLIISIMMVFGLIGFKLLGLTFSIVTMLLIFYFVTSALQLNNTLNQWKQRISELENR